MKKTLSASNTDDAPENKKKIIQLKCVHDVYKFQKHTIFKCYWDIKLYRGLVHHQNMPLYMSCHSSRH